jgi:hypothetical protein
MSYRSGEQIVVPLSGRGRFRERLAVNKETMKRFNLERFNIKKLNKVRGKEQHWVKISNRFAALENLRDNGDINTAWEATSI